MANVRFINDFKDAPKDWTEYKRLGIVFMCFCLSAASVYVFEKHWVTVVAVCLSLILLIVQVEVSRGSTYRNVCLGYEEYLKTLNKSQLSWLINEVSIDDESKQFAIDFVKHHQIRLSEE